MLMTGEALSSGAGSGLGLLETLFHFTPQGRASYAPPPLRTRRLRITLAGGRDVPQLVSGLSLDSNLDLADGTSGHWLVFSPSWSLPSLSLDPPGGQFLFPLGPSAPEPPTDLCTHPLLVSRVFQSTRSPFSSLPHSLGRSP